ncbi:mannose-1-phosphate guanylyltransferase (GDP) /mannose-6-phosphate isomerase, type 2 [Granulicella rosea]|uniref:mannose-1-phosphate guanylyltransferase n=1 Tax=Granulicella rosea TaxID=474952 RepID=A0A239MRC4_9BACT|nr:sugar phosphate nucleotidyltransferase [Granulicella rosea]SNT44823.1 mannose-1-phosphate guanylyltransferase (GDP) /mannose-6-phosphate isomerase, type 2 [Granulicella rosea]
MSIEAGSGIRFAPVILAGGSGTRFWPRSRRARAKQVLALDGDDTMIQQTLMRLLPVADVSDVWVITNRLLDKTISEQLPMISPDHILSEPSARNTAPACALAAFLLEPTEPETVIGIFPSDHVVANVRRFAEVIAAGVKVAAAGENIVVLGVPPTRPETGYGYVEQGAVTETIGDIPVTRVKRFREKPDKHTAEKFLAAGNFAWNGGIFLWSARTLANAIREHVPDMAPLLEKIAAAHGTPEFEAVFAEFYPQCENISVDYAILERRSAKGELKSNIYCLPADFDWNDLGSWASLHEHLGENDDSNVLDGATTGLVTIESSGNYVYAPGKMVALLGVEGLVVVETPDALLITTRERSQDVSKVVRALHIDMGREELI